MMPAVGTTPRLATATPSVPYTTTLTGWVWSFACLVRMQVRKDTAKMQAKRYELIQPMHRLFLPEAWTPIHLDAPNEFYKVKTPASAEWS